MRSIIEAFRYMKIIPQFTFHGIGISLGGSSGSSSSSTTTDIDQEKLAEESGTTDSSTLALATTDQTSTGTTTGSSTTTAEGVETSTLSLLDEDTQNLISNLMQDIVGGDGGNAELLSLLETRALDADNAFSGIVDPQVEEARRLQEQDLGGTVQALSRATGGGAKSNSLVAGFNLEGSRAIDSAMASLAATLGIESRNAATAEISGAFEAGLVETQASSSAVAALADVLKGADQTGTKLVESTESTSSIEDVMQQLTSATTESEVQSIIENLFSKETLTGTESSTTGGSSKEASAGFSLGF